MHENQLKTAVLECWLHTRRPKGKNVGYQCVRGWSPILSEMHLALQRTKFQHVSAQPLKHLLQSHTTSSIRLAHPKVLKVSLWLTLANPLSARLQQIVFPSELDPSTRNHSHSAALDQQLHEDMDLIRNLFMSLKPGLDIRGRSCWEAPVCSNEHLEALPWQSENLPTEVSLLRSLEFTVSKQ